MERLRKRIRLNHIFKGAGKKALVVAFDHPLIYGPIAGTTNPFEQIRAFADAGADAVLMNSAYAHRRSFA